MTAAQRRSRDIWLVTLASLFLGACAPAPQAIPLTPPPIPPRSQSLNAVDWTNLVVPGGGDVYRIERAAANQTDVVAIGYDEAGPGSRGAIWHSRDGVAFVRVDEDLTEAVTMIDVAAGPAGFVAVGVEGTGPDIVVLVSSEGRTWERMPADQALSTAMVSAVAGRDSSWIMVGAEADGAPLFWVSVDGRVWERQSAATMGLERSAVLADVEVAGDLWLAAGETRHGTAALFWSNTGTAWQTVIPSGDEGGHPVRMTDLAVSKSAMIVRGEAAPSCDLFAACQPIPAAWWSTDAEHWGALPDHEAIRAQAMVAGDFGFLAIGGTQSFSSFDGLSWSALLAALDDRTLVHDAVVFGDVVIAVGERTGAGGSKPWLASGALR